MKYTPLDWPDYSREHEYSYQSFFTKDKTPKPTLQEDVPASFDRSNPNRNLTQLFGTGFSGETSRALSFIRTICPARGSDFPENQITLGASDILDQSILHSLSMVIGPRPHPPQGFFRTNNMKYPRMGDLYAGLVFPAKDGHRWRPMVEITAWRADIKELRVCFHRIIPIRFFGDNMLRYTSGEISEKWQASAIGTLF